MRMKEILLTPLDCIVIELRTFAVGGGGGGEATGDRYDIRFSSCPRKNKRTGFSQNYGQNKRSRNEEFQKLSR
jgi:hypothetical protein